MKYFVISSAISLLLFPFCPGCSNNKTVESEKEPKIESSEEHDRVYLEACDLIKPYMHLQGVDSPSAKDEEARKEITRGIEMLQRVVEFNSQNWNAYWVMGKAYQALDQSEAAVKAFKSSFEINRNDPDIAREFMFECLRLGRGEDAVTAAKHAVNLKPDDAGLVANLGLAYLIAGNLDDAMVAVNESLELQADDPITRNVKKIIEEVQNGSRAQPKSLSDLE